MSGKSRDRATLDGMAHKHYGDSITGTAAVEYALPLTVLRVDDVQVYVSGLLKRPADASGVHDYQIRGLHSNTPAGSPYPGDSNMIKFAVAPNGLHVRFITAGG